jgi:anhydro-N-acetylmuramic acid kinase
LARKSGNTERLFVGVMSGTSVDAIDAALIGVERRGKEMRGGGYAARVIAHIEHAWPKKLRGRLLEAMAPAMVATAELCELGFAVSREFAAAVEQVIGAAGISRDQVAAIGSHGQTLCHLPPTKQGMGSTLQIGDVSVIATLTGIRTVGNFRTADMAAGGQGAPLVPWTDAALLRDAAVTRCMQNIGGIANVTYLPALPAGAAGDAAVRAFDTGPGNMMIDAAVRQGSGGRAGYDRGGRLAARGSLERNLFRTLQAHPYFDREPPKSTGRELFGGTFVQELLRRHRRVKLEDLVCTLTRLTAWSIADAYLRYLPELPREVVLCGGGADNPVLVEMLREELGHLRSDYTHPEPPTLRRIDEFGIPNKSKEAASFALLAAATLDGVPANLISATGAARPVILGVVANPQIKSE